MLNQKIQNPNPDELMIEVDLCYELDPYELKLDEMIEAEPEPEMIEGLPASDALTPADRYLELFEHVQSAKIFPDSKTFPDCAPKMDPLDILIRYRKCAVIVILTCASLLKTTSGYRRSTPASMYRTRKIP